MFTHFFYSKKHAEHYKSTNKGLNAKDRWCQKNSCKLESGEIKFYTLMEDSESRCKPITKETDHFDDYVWLGVGDFHRNEGVWGEKDNV